MPQMPQLNALFLTPVLRAPRLSHVTLSHFIIIIHLSIFCSIFPLLEASLELIPGDSGHKAGGNSSFRHNCSQQHTHTLTRTHTHTDTPVHTLYNLKDVFQSTTHVFGLGYETPKEPQEEHANCATHTQGRDRIQPATLQMPGKCANHYAFVEPHTLLSSLVVVVIIKFPTCLNLSSRVA